MAAPNQPLWQRARFDCGELPKETVPAELHPFLGILLWVRYGPPRDPEDALREEAARLRAAGGTGTIYNGVTGEPLQTPLKDLASREQRAEDNRANADDVVEEKKLLVYYTNLIGRHGEAILMPRQFIELVGHELECFSWTNVARERLIAPKANRSGS